MVSPVSNRNKTQRAYGRKSGSLSADHQGWEGEEKVTRGKTPRREAGEGMGKDERRNLREEKKEMSKRKRPQACICLLSRWEEGSAKVCSSILSTFIWNRL